MPFPITCNTFVTLSFAKVWLSTLLSAFLLGCGGVAGPTEPAPVDPKNCTAPTGHTLSDIESVTDWINAMPKPLELPCFLASLPRPMSVNLTRSVFSAQPANGRRNPRIFIFIDKLIFSVVPQEAPLDGSTEPPPNLLEMSLHTSGISSIKAELVFPVTATLPYSAAYIRLQRAQSNLSVCGICHSTEVQVGDFDGVPVDESQMLAPYPEAEITLEFLLNEQVICNPMNETHRCAMLDAVLGDGDVMWRDFPPEVPVL